MGKYINGFYYHHIWDFCIKDWAKAMADLFKFFGHDAIIKSVKGSFISPVTNSDIFNGVYVRYSWEN